MQWESAGDGEGEEQASTVTMLKYGNGDVYTGEMRGGRPDGEGKMLYKNGNEYEGGWVGGLEEGDGMLRMKRERSRWRGSFRAGARHGWGQLMFRGGATFSGRWEYGAQREGEWYMDGVREKGCFRGGKLDGEGRRENKDGSVWEGTFRKGLRHGRGTYTPPSGGGEAQEGVWQNDEVDHDHTRRAMAFEHMQGAGDVRCERIKCPITHGPLLDPVTCADGHTYDRCAMYEWLRRRRVSPVTNEALAKTGMHVSVAVRGFVEDELDRYAAEMDAARQAGASAERKAPAASAHPDKRRAPAASARPAKKPRGRGAM